MALMSASEIALFFMLAIRVSEQRADVVTVRAGSVDSGQSLAMFLTAALSYELAKPTAQPIIISRPESFQNRLHLRPR